MTGTDQLLTRHGEALDLFGDRVRTVRDDQWDAPTPCTDWAVRDLVDHLVSEQLWVPWKVRDGATVEAVGDVFDGDVLGSDPVAAWDTSARASRDAFAAPGVLDHTVHLSFGDTTAAVYCAQMVTDLAVHTGDLSRAIGADERLPKDVLEFAVGEVTPYAADLAKTGFFAAPAKPPPGADPQTELLCLLGRAP